MAETSELKPKSFRIDDETNEKLKLIMKDFPNQNLALQKMVEVYEFQQGKESIADRKADIEEFEKYVSCLVRMYMTSLESNQNQKELIRGEFDSQLRTLKEKLDNARQEKDDIALNSKKYASENEQLKQSMERLKTEYNAKIDSMQDILKEKEESNQLLKSAGADLKAKVEQMTVEVEQTKVIRQELDSLKIQYDKLETAYKSLQAESSHEKEKYEKELAETKKNENEAIERVKAQEQFTLNKTILELEKQHQEQLQQLKEQQQKEIDKYQKKYLALLEQIEKIREEKVSKGTKIENSQS